MKQQNTIRTFLDVRSPDEYYNAHIKGAVNIPLDQLQQRIAELVDLPKPLIVYCQSGGRSAMAVAILKQMGISSAINGGALENFKMSYENTIA